MTHPLEAKYKLGKQAPIDDPRDLMLASYLDKSKLPPLPDGDFTCADLVGPDEWGMLLNDRLGCCAPAGISHAQLAMGRVGGHHPVFTNDSVRRGYELMGHYVPGQESTDQGCSLRTCAKVWQKHGIPGSATVGGGTEEQDMEWHRSGIYLFLEPGNLMEQFYATLLFKNAINGYNLPANWMEAFDEGDYVWDFDADAKSLGGHCVPAFGREGDGTDGVSWGHRVRVTGRGIENKMDEGFTVVSSSILTTTANQRVEEVVDLEKLKADLHALGVAYPEYAIA